MSNLQELASAKYLNNVSESEPVDEKPVASPAGHSRLSLVQNMMLCVVLAISSAFAGLWLLQPAGKTKSNSGANFFLWITGSNMTWDQYQRQQQARGNQRMDEKEYDWQQQLFNDAYSAR